MWLLAVALSALGIALVAILLYGALRGGREFARECLTYEGVDE